MGDILPHGQDKYVGKAVAKGGAWMLSARFIRVAITMGGIAYLARVLSPENFGVLAVATALSTLCNLLLDGLIEMPVVRHREITKTGLRSLVLVALVMILAVSVPIWILAISIENLASFPNLGMGMRAAVLTMIATIWIVVGRAALRRNHRFFSVALIQVVQTASYYLIAVLLAANGYQLFSLLAGLVISTYITAIISILVAKVDGRPTLRLKLELLKDTALSGASAKVFGWFWTNIDTFAVAFLFGPAATGIYSRAYNIGTQIKEPFLAIDTAIRQGFISVHHARPEGLYDVFDRVTKLSFSISVFICVFGILRSEDIVAVLLGPKWMSSAPILEIFLLSLPARIALVSMDSLTIAGREMHLLTRRHALAAGIVASGILLLGQVGPVAIATIVVIAIWATLLYVICTLKIQHHKLIISLAQASIIGLFLGMPALLPDFIFPQADHVMMLFLSILATVPGVFFALLLWPDSWLPGSVQMLRQSVKAKVGLN